LPYKAPEGETTKPWLKAVRSVCALFPHTLQDQLWRGWIQSSELILSSLPLLVVNNKRSTLRVSQHSDKWGQGGEPKVAFDEFGSSEGLVYILSSLHGCVLMSKGTVNRSRELTSRGAEMDVGSSVSCCFICYLEWPVGSLGKRLSHLCLFKDTCFVSSWAFSFCGRLSLSWLNPELLIHIRVLNN